MNMSLNNRPVAEKVDFQISKVVFDMLDEIAEKCDVARESVMREAVKEYYGKKLKECP